MRQYLSLAAVTFCMATQVGAPLAEDISITTNATIRVVPFTAQYGQNNLQLTGGNTSRIVMPNHIPCTQDSGISADQALQRICAPAKAYYTRIGNSGGNRCGYDLYAGVCVSVR